MPLHRRALIGGIASLWAGTAVGRDPAGSAAIAALVEGGSVALIRHATAPGTGDPPGFRLGDCATQRNLSEQGRRQATELGQRLASAGVKVSAARSSRWCRALDTARLAFPEITVEPDPALDSFFGDAGSRAPQTEAARALVSAWEGQAGVLALVTHQVNITALTNIFPAEGEIVVLKPRAGEMGLVGRLRA